MGQNDERQSLCKFTTSWNSTAFICRKQIVKQRNVKKQKDKKQNSISQKTPPNFFQPPNFAIKSTILLAFKARVENNLVAFLENISRDRIQVLRKIWSW